MLYGDQIAKLEGEILRGELIPKHGPGATADGLIGNRKWHHLYWHDRLEYLFPFGEYGIPNWSYASQYEETQFIAPADERPAKLIAVPKTLTKPRLISAEPTVMQYVQQALSIPLREYLESHPLSESFLGFSDQTPNQEMARIGSKDCTLATLDLSEASDRVANWIVEDMFADFPTFLEGIQACRSRRVQLPSGEVIPLLKFASMGSALTFPIEAMVFTAIVIERILHASSKRVTPKSIKRLRGLVRVYGDDIIVPVDMADTVIDGLETFGLKVNRSKSFWTGEFRESCGKEYWRGHDVSIVKVRKALPASRRDVDELVSTVATRNLFYKAGLKRTAMAMDKTINILLAGNYPVVEETSPILGRISDLEPLSRDFWNEDLFRWETRGYMPVAKPPNNAVNDWQALMKVLVTSARQSLPRLWNQDSSQTVDEEHLTRSGRPRVVKLKLSKGLPY